MSSGKKIAIAVILLFLAGCAPASKYQAFESTSPPVPPPGPVVMVERIPGCLAVLDDLAKMSDEEKVTMKQYEAVSPSDFFSMLPGTTSYAVSMLDPELKISVPSWSGTVKGLLLAVQRANGLFFETSDGKSFVVRDDSTFSLRLVDQGQTVMIKSVIEKLGGTDVVVDSAAGAVIFSADSRGYAEIQKYLRSYPISVVDLEVVFLENELSSDSAYGLDFEKLKISLLQLSTTPVLAAASIESLTDGGFKASLTSGVFSMAAVLQSLEKYGKYSLLQRVHVGVISGQKLLLDVSEKRPYVSEITSTAGQSGPAVRGYKMADASAGLILDASVSVQGADFVSVTADMRYQTIVEYVRVGTEADSVQSPVVAVRNSKSFLILRPGQVERLATIRYSKTADKSSGLYGLSRSLQGRNVRDYEINVLCRAVLKRYIYD